MARCSQWAQENQKKNPAIGIPIEKNHAMILGKKRGPSKRKSGIAFESGRLINNPSKRICVQAGG
jgi:hypothetical protein